MVLFRAGAAKHALIAAGNQMLVVPITASVRVTDRGVELAGMRAATTGSVDLTGVKVKEDWLIGAPGDYLREPTFSTGAWRSSAVALGGLAALIETAKDELRSRAARTTHSSGCVSGQTILAPGTGRLWLLEGDRRIDSTDKKEAVAYMNLARTAIETAILDALRHMQRSLGLSAFIEGSKTERIARDLATYLRQPAPDDVLVEAAGCFIHRGDTAQ
jgi:hypothetical protein